MLVPAARGRLTTFFTMAAVTTRRASFTLTVEHETILHIVSPGPNGGREQDRNPLAFYASAVQRSGKNTDEIFWPERRSIRSFYLHILMYEHN